MGIIQICQLCKDVVKEVCGVVNFHHLGNCRVILDYIVWESFTDSTYLGEVIICIESYYWENLFDLITSFELVRVPFFLIDPGWDCELLYQLGFSEGFDRFTSSRRFPACLRLTWNSASVGGIVGWVEFISIEHIEGWLALARPLSWCQEPRLPLTTDVQPGTEDKV